MGKLIAGRPPLASLTVLGLMLLAAAGATAGPPLDHEVVLAGGLASPRGDLGDGFVIDDPDHKGRGAETGYTVGFRFRYFLTPTWAISPSFSFFDFGDFHAYDLDPDDPDMVLILSPSIIRYAIDLQHFLAGPRESFRPFLTGGVSLNRNRYREDLKRRGNPLYFYETSVNGLGLAFGAGLRAKIFELSCLYHLNRFSTVRILGGSEKVTHNWDFLVLQVGYALPTR